MAGIPPSKKPVTKGVTPAVVAKKAPVKPPVAKAAMAKPAVAQPAPAVRKVEPVKVETPVAVVPTKVEAPVAAAPKVELPKVAAPKVEAAKTETKIESAKIETPAAPVVAAAPTKGSIMNDTITNAQATMKNAAEDMQNRATAMFGDMNTRAKDAMSKGTKAIEELVEFSKGNVEAIVASGRVAAKGAEEIAKYSAEYGRSTVEKANATAKQFAAVKSPTEFFQLQGEVAKQTLDALVAEGSKFTESYLKLIGEISQPISNRVAVAAEKVKTTIAA